MRDTPVTELFGVRYKQSGSIPARAFSQIVVFIASDAAKKTLGL